MKCAICEQNAQVSYEAKNPFTKKVVCPHCGTYYIEPPFAQALENLRARYNRDERVERILGEMKRVIKESELVAFIYDFEKHHTCAGNAYQVVALCCQCR